MRIILAAGVEGGATWCEPGFECLLEKRVEYWDLTFLLGERLKEEGLLDIRALCCTVPGVAYELGIDEQVSDRKLKENGLEDLRDGKSFILWRRLFF